MLSNFRSCLLRSISNSSLSSCLMIAKFAPIHRLPGSPVSVQPGFGMRQWAARGRSLPWAVGLGLSAIAIWAGPAVAWVPSAAPAMLASARPIAGAEESYQRGLALIMQGEFRDAIVEFNRAIRMDPTYAEAYHDRGNAYSGLGNEVAAFADYNKAITLDPDYGNAYYNRGNLYLQREQYHQAIADYDRAIELNAEDAESHHNRALAQAMLGELAAAVTNLQQAAQLFAAAGDQDGFNRALEALRYLQPDLDPSNLPSPAAHSSPSPDSIPDTTASRTPRTR